MIGLIHSTPRPAAAGKTRGLPAFLVPALLVAAGALSTPAESREPELRLGLDPERSDGIIGCNSKGGRELEELLQQGLRVVTGDEAGPVPVLFVSVLIRDRRPDETFVSRPFEATPGLLIESAGGAYPPQVPDDLFAVGEPVSTATSEYPSRRLEDYAARVAMEAAQRARSPDGLFMVLVPADPGARREIPAGGLMIPMSERRH